MEMIADERELTNLNYLRLESGIFALLAVQAGLVGTAHGAYVGRHALFGPSALWHVTLQRVHLHSSLSAGLLSLRESSSGINPTYQYITVFFRSFRPTFTATLGEPSPSSPPFHPIHTSLTSSIPIFFLYLLHRNIATGTMAEAIGLASGLLALATFAFQSSITLINTIQSFQNHSTRVRDLKQELEALTAVLAPLTETVDASNNADLSALSLPLLRCGHSCREFQEEIIKCSSRSGGNRTSFRDWAKLKYMGDGIDEFRQLMAGYKSTIIIALTDANLSVFIFL
jgi:Fungal N-terminal domain of STAND proteins